jgi:NhaP-type Na+/H+ or K+/H+ antiporter|tara:strand:+ start:81 stop:287 length:207 start_codon:yes stop_codon:yes gene_type:complete
MIDDDLSGHIHAGFWPFMKRALFLFLPFWVFLLCYSMEFNNIISAAAAGGSLSIIVFYEQRKLKQMNT